MKATETQEAVMARWLELGYVAFALDRAHLFRGFPSVFFLKPKGKAFFIQFTSKGGACTDSQIECQNRLRKSGFNVYVCDTVAAGTGILRRELNGKRSELPWFVA